METESINDANGNPLPQSSTNIQETASPALVISTSGSRQWDVVHRIALFVIIFLVFLWLGCIFFWLITKKQHHNLEQNYQLYEKNNTLG